MDASLRWGDEPGKGAALSRTPLPVSFLAVGPGASHIGIERALSCAAAKKVRNHSR